VGRGLQRLRVVSSEGDAVCRSANPLFLKPLTATQFGVDKNDGPCVSLEIKLPPG
jgi:hypothetical protein